MDIIRGFANLPKITLSTCGRDDDVFIDRLNYKYTTTILFISSITITIKILQSDHIQCWVPAILAKYEHYINVYCWISNTYYVSFTEQTTSLRNKPERMLKYYQWVPMILLCLALFFLIPRFIYRFLSKQSGLDMLNLADASINYMSVEKFDKRRRSLLYLANSIHFYSICNKSKRTKDGFISTSTFGASSGTPIIGASSSKPYLYNLIFCHGKLNGSYLTILYMLTKLFYLVNSIAQIFILNIFLGFNYNSHGMYVLIELLKSMFSRTHIPLAQQQQRRQEAEAAANQFASNLNLNQMSPSIKGPTVIFDTNEEFNSNTFSGSSNLGSGHNGIYADTIYSEVSVNSLLHRYFPRESACDFRIRANIDSLVHNYTVQCVLPINLYNEQLFTLLWAWFWFVCIANAYDFSIWIIRLFPSSRYNYIRARTRLRYSENSVKRSLNSFVYDYLTFDGVFVLRIMSLSMSDCVTHEIIQTLWQNYTEGNTANRGGRQEMMSSGSGQGRVGTGQTAASIRDSQRMQRYSQMRGTGVSSGGVSSGGMGMQGEAEYHNQYQDENRGRYQSNYSNVENI